MLLSEIFAENLPGPEPTLRFRPAPGFNHFRLSTDHSNLLRSLVRSLFFPQSAGLSELEPATQAAQFQCGLMFQIGGRVVQVQRGLAPETAVLYLLTEQAVFQSLAHGARSVESTLQNLIGIRHLEALDALHLGYFAQQPLSAEEGAGLGTPGDALGLAGALAPIPDSPGREAFDRTLQEPGRGDGVTGLDDQMSFGLVSLREEDSGISGQRDKNLEALRDPLAFGLRDPLAPAASVDGVADRVPTGARAAAMPSRSGTPSEGTIEQLRREYRKARQVESLDTKIGGVEARLAQIATDLQQLTGGEQELQQVRQQLANLPDTDKVSAGEREMLLSESVRRQQLYKRWELLKARMTAVKTDSPRRTSLVLNPIFLLGLAATLLCTVISIVGGVRLRPVALGNLIGLSGALFGVLQYLRDRSAEKKVSVKMSLLKNQTAELEHEQQRLDQEMEEIRRRAGVKTSEELFETASRRESLRQTEQLLQQKWEEQRQKPEYRTLNEQRQRLEKELDSLLRERSKLGECSLSSEQISQELAYYNITVSDLEKESPVRPDGTSGMRPAVRGGSPLQLLYQIVEEFGLTSKGELDDDVAELWGRITSRLLGRPISAPRFLEGGVIVIGGQPPTIWSELNPIDQYLCREALCLSTLVLSIGRVKPSPPPFILRFSPTGSLHREQAENLLDFYQRLAKHMQITVFG